MRNEDELMNYAIKQEAICRKNDSISDALFEEYGVNRGLRDMNGKGVLTGLTTISKIVSFQNVNGVQTPCDGQLWYRGYNVQNLVKCIGIRSERQDTTSHGVHNIPGGRFHNHISGKISRKGSALRHNLTELLQFFLTWSLSK